MKTTANQIKNLLSKGDTNAKTKKNIRETLILYLSPANQNDFGVNLCPKASKGCLMSCLYLAGRGAFNTTQNARIRKTNFLLGNRFVFIEQIAKEINNKAKRVKGELAIRLNGTSDYKLVEMVTSLHEIASNVVFYDYTKIPTKAGDKILKSGHRYVVCFSRAEDNEQTALDILKNGGISSFVFANELPATYKGFKVIDGDERDDLMLDIEGGTIIGLRAKGHKAKKDTSGFVIQ
jgi:hypothetical protein